MKISRSEVEHVARLARLALTEAEVDTLTGQMDAILDYVEQLNRLDTDGILPTAHAVPMENAFREDMRALIPGHRQGPAERPRRRRRLLPRAEGNRIEARLAARGTRPAGKAQTCPVFPARLVFKPFAPCR